MRGWAIAALALFLVGPLAAAQDPGADDGETTSPDAVERPVFTVGDWWTYRLKGDITGVSTSTVERRENLTVNGTTFDVWRIGAQVDASATRVTYVFSESFAETKWVLATNHAKLRTYAASSEDAAQGARRTETYDPPQPELRYPFVRGDEWVFRSNVTREEVRTIGGTERPDSKETVTFPDRVTARVAGKVRLTVPSGPFITYLIEFHSQDAYSDRFFRWYYAPEACTNVLEEYYETETDLRPRISYELTEWQCTQPAEALDETPDVTPPPPPPGTNATVEPPEDVQPRKTTKRGLPGFDAAPAFAAGAVAAALAGTLAGRRRRDGT